MKPNEPSRDSHFSHARHALSTPMNEMTCGTSDTAAIAVSCLVLMDVERAVLAVRRPFNKALGGLWEFPGGKIEANETPETALRRELSEELELDLGTLRPLTPVGHAYDFGTILLVPFLACCDRRPEFTLVEHTDHKWVSLSEDATLSWAPADLPVLDEVRRLSK